MGAENMDMDGRVPKRKNNDLTADQTGNPLNERHTQLLEEIFGGVKRVEGKLEAVEAMVHGVKSELRTQEQYLKLNLADTHQVQQKLCELQSVVEACLLWDYSDMGMRERSNKLVMKGVFFSEVKGRAYIEPAVVKAKLYGILMDVLQLNKERIGPIVNVAAYWVEKARYYNVAFAVLDTEVSKELLKGRALLRTKGFGLDVELMQHEQQNKRLIQSSPAFMAAVQEALKQPKHVAPIYWQLDRCLIGKGKDKQIWTAEHVKALAATTPLAGATAESAAAAAHEQRMTQAAVAAVEQQQRREQAAADYEAAAAAAEAAAAAAATAAGAAAGAAAVEGLSEPSSNPLTPTAAAAAAAAAATGARGSKHRQHSHPSAAPPRPSNNSGPGAASRQVPAGPLPPPHKHWSADS